MASQSGWLWQLLITLNHLRLSRIGQGFEFITLVDTVGIEPASGDPLWNRDNQVRRLTPRTCLIVLRNASASSISPPAFSSENSNP